MPCPTNAEEHAHMKMRQLQNRAICVRNRNENWMATRLLATGLKWTRQSQWGWRLFDFWNAHLGIAVEVDGPEHSPRYDSIRDRYNAHRSAIIVIRVRNRNEEDARAAISRIKSSESWNTRRIAQGLKPLTNNGIPIP